MLKAEEKLEIGGGRLSEFRQILSQEPSRYDLAR